MNQNSSNNSASSPHGGSRGLVTGIILAGGKSSRMGTDKGLMFYKGRPMIQHILDPMAKICHRILIVTSNPMYGMFGFELVKDEQPDYGPVMGLLSGLRQSKTDINLVMSCDAPLVGFDLMKQLVLATGVADVVAARSSVGLHPLIAVYKKRCISGLETAINEDEHRLRTVLESFHVQVFDVEKEKEELLRNMNTREDLRP